MDVQELFTKQLTVSRISKSLMVEGHTDTKYFNQTLLPESSSSKCLTGSGLPFNLPLSTGIKWY